MKNKTPVNRALIPSIKKPSDGLPIKPNPVIAIKTNVCEEKNDCPLCSFHPYYGTELAFLIYYANKTIQTVCYKCGKRVAEEIGVKCPTTEPEIRYSVEAKFKEGQRAARKHEVIKSDESKKRWLHNVDTNRYNVQVNVSLWKTI